MSVNRNEILTRPRGTFSDRTRGTAEDYLERMTHYTSLKPVYVAETERELQGAELYVPDGEAIPIPISAETAISIADLEKRVAGIVKKL